MRGDEFIRSLFDVSFTSLVTTRVIKFLYVLSMILIALGALVFIFAAFRADVITGILVLGIVAPFVSLLYLTYVRVLLEIVIAVFRIMETNVELVTLARGQAPATAGAPPPSTPPPPAAWPGPSVP